MDDTEEQPLDDGFMINDDLDLEGDAGIIVDDEKEEDPDDHFH